jgi:hypothetical protein
MPKHWQATGWRVVGRRGVIQYTCTLPCGAGARIFREKPGYPWRIILDGDHGKPRGRFFSAPAAMRSAENELRTGLRSALRMVGG